MLRALGLTGMTLAMLACEGPASAANSPLVVWQGGVTITKLTPACSTIGFSVGELVDSIYRPRLLSDEPPSALSLITARSGQIYFNATTSSNDQMVGKGNFNAHLIGARATAVPNSTQGPFTGKYNFKVQPKVITDATGAITISGSLTNFFNVDGCTAEFLGAYQPRGN